MEYAQTLNETAITYTERRRSLFVKAYVSLREFTTNYVKTRYARLLTDRFFFTLGARHKVLPAVIPY